MSRLAWAQTYPTRPVRILVGAATGGPLDIVARLMGQWLSERLGQQFVIENRTGAGINLATEAVVRAPPDGYTMLLVATTNAINATLYDKLSFNFIRDIAPVAGTLRVPQVLEVNPSVPVATVAEFIAYAKANPGKINMGSGGIGSVAHVGGELFKMMSGVDMVHVPYRGSVPMLTDLIGGQLQGAFDPMPGSIALIEAGQLRALAVTTATRSAALPDIPTVSESLPGYEASTWMASASLKALPPRSSTRSIGRSTPHSPIPRSRRGLPTSAVWFFQAPPPTSPSLLPTKPRSGARSSGQPTSNPSKDSRNLRRYSHSSG